MRGKWTSLALSLGLLASSARGDDGNWRPQPLRPGEVSQSLQKAANPAAALQRPIVRGAAPAEPAVTLERPVPLPDGGATRVYDPRVRPTSFDGAPLDLPPVVRGQNQDGLPVRPIPAGMPVARTAGLVTTWRRPGENASTLPEPDPVPSVSATGSPAPSTVAYPAGPPSPAIWSMFTHGNCDVNGPCAPACNGPECGTCCPPGNRYYASAEYILWWIKGSPLPPLLTAGSAGDPIPGALGLPGTVVLFGGSRVGDDARSGGRFVVGHWFDEDHTLGIEGSYFFLGSRTDSFTATSFGNPILARPIIDATTGMETAQGVAGGALAGTFNTSLRSSLWGAEGNLRSNLCCGCNWFVDGIIGFRALGLNEDLNVSENLIVVRGANAGNTFQVTDLFSTRNNFYGGQLGLVSEWRRGRWSLDLKTKVALGSTHQVAEINGSTVINGTPFTGGLLALPSNIGRFSRDFFTWAPEVGLNLGYQFTPHLRGYVGYNFLYWSDVLRPGNQIDRVVNVNQLPPAIPGGPARPAFTFNGSDFWAQGVNFGLEFRY
jgi:hypothetical protein